jgi:uncharacterized protein
MRESPHHCHFDRRDQITKELTLMKYFAAFLPVRDLEKSQELRPAHLAFLGQKEREGKIFARGRFSDGAGGLIIYRAESFDEARKVAESDPYVKNGARSLELHEWEMKITE